MLPLGSAAPDFSLPDVTSGRNYSLADFPPSEPLLVMFICRHCPYVVHVQQELARLGRDYAGRVGMVAISANDAAAYPDDAPASLRHMAAEQGFVFPFLYDEPQTTARAYGAACTPDFFLFEAQPRGGAPGVPAVRRAGAQAEGRSAKEAASRRLAYRGQLDDSRPNSGRPVTGRDLRAAMDALLAGQPVASVQHPSLGCSIKWKAA